MGIEFWAGFWGLVLLAGCLLFLGLALVVTVGGLREVRVLFRSMERGFASCQVKPGAGGRHKD